jgi:hypothetical protein
MVILVISYTYLPFAGLRSLEFVYFAHPTTPFTPVIFPRVPTDLVHYVPLLNHDIILAALPNSSAVLRRFIYRNLYRNIYTEASGSYSSDSHADLPF